MFICAAGDIHGALDRFYEDVLAFEESLGARFDYVLHLGDFGVWPDPNRVDKATRKHDGAGDFPIWFAENRPFTSARMLCRPQQRGDAGQSHGGGYAGAEKWLRDPGRMAASRAAEFLNAWSRAGLFLENPLVRDLIHSNSSAPG